MTDVPTINDRISRRLGELGLSERQASLLATGKPDAIRYIRTRSVMPSLPRLFQIANALKTSVDYLIGSTEDPNPNESQRDLIGSTANLTNEGFDSLARVGDEAVSNQVNDDHKRFQGVYQSALHSFVPIPSIDGTPMLVGLYEFIDEVVSFCRTLPKMKALKANATRLNEISMRPAFDAGDLIIFTAQATPKVRDYGLFCFDLPESREKNKLIWTLKRLVREEGDSYILQQFEPPVLLRLAKERVHAAYRLIPYNELMEPHGKNAVQC